MKITLDVLTDTDNTYPPDLELQASPNNDECVCITLVAPNRTIIVSKRELRRALRTLTED